MFRSKNVAKYLVRLPCDGALVYLVCKQSGRCITCLKKGRALRLDTANYNN